MKLKQYCVHGIMRAEIEIQPNKTTLIVGENGQGKSSLLDGLLANVTATPVPKGYTKAEAAKFVNDKASTGSVTLESPFGVRHVNYPTCEVFTENGSGITIGEWAAGVNRWTSLKPKERAEQLVAITGTKVTPDRLRDALGGIAMGPHSLPAQAIDKYVGICAASGWDAALRQLETRVTELGRDFQNATGVKWGSEQGLTFRPVGWEDDLEQLTIEELQKAVELAKAELETAIGKNAVIKAATKTVQSPVEDIDPDRVKFWEDDLAKYKGQMLSYQQELSAAKAASRNITCSVCGAIGMVQGDKLVVGGESSSHRQYSEIERDLKRVTDLAHNAMQKIEFIKLKQEQMEVCQEYASEQVNVEEFRAAHFKAEMRAKAKAAKIKGLQLHWTIALLSEAKKLMQPTGLPMKALQDALSQFNKVLEVLSQSAGWGIVQIVGEDLRLALNGRSIRLSASEIYRCSVTLQVAIAATAGDTMVIIDEADVLGMPGRNSLFKMLKGQAITAVVAMTVSHEKDGSFKVPDLAAKGLGMTYVVNAGVVTPYRAEAAA